MTLHSDALELLKTLRRVVDALRQFKHSSGAPYADEIADRLEPLVTDFERAVAEERFRTAAADILDFISPLMDNVNRAASKGDLAIFPNHNDETLNQYFHLKTIFRESNFADQEL